MSKTSAKQPWTLERTFPWILTIGGVLGLLSSLILTYDKIKIAANPNYIPSCNLNPVIACGSVIKTPQASALGFPNSFIGIAGFAIVLCIGVALLAGLNPKNLKNWFWWGLNLGALFGISMVYWLFFQTVYRIHALCPYCMVVWTVTIPIFWYTLLWNLRNGFIKPPAKLKGAASFIQKHHGDILLVFYLIIIIAIGTHFWYYWKTLI